MGKFSPQSEARLETCDYRIRAVMREVVKHFDCSILCGHRGEEEQNRAFAEGKSKKKFPESLHNSIPSKAVDVAPHPLDWKDRERFTFFAGFVLGIARTMGVNLRWGGDWNRDTEVKDNSFDDLPHFELVD